MIRPLGKPAFLLRQVGYGILTPLLDHRIFEDYREVLSRPRFPIGRQDREDILVLLRRSGEFVDAVPIGIVLPDPSDLPFLEVAVHGLADALITGNLRDYPEGARRGVRVVTPAEFLAEWGADPGRGPLLPQG